MISPYFWYVYRKLQFYLLPLTWILNAECDLEVSNLLNQQNGPPSAVSPVQPVYSPITDRQSEAAPADVTSAESGDNQDIILMSKRRKSGPKKWNRNVRKAGRQQGRGICK
jgi:hypothetical protein